MKTKRILSLIVAAVMLIATISVIGILTVNAETTSIGDAEAFKGISGSGEYKLTADIDLTDVDTLASFSGTLDGGGFTVTVNKPIFNTLSGTVKNLTIEGSITSDSTGAVGALANTVSGDLTVTSVTNSASVTANSGVGVGGFIGLVDMDTAVTVSFTNCTNTAAVSGGKGVAGFVGKANNSSSDTSHYTSFTYTDCLNSGNITETLSESHRCGAAGFFGFGHKRTDVTMLRCVNTGTISSAGGDFGTGGLYGSGTWSNGDAQIIDISYCVNTGKVSSSDAARVGGIVGRVNKYSSNCMINYCYNTGDLSSATNGATGILGYANCSASTAIMVTNCYNVGTLTGGSGTVAVARINTPGKSTTSNLFYVGTDTVKLSSESPEESTKECANAAELNSMLLGITSSAYCVDADVNDGYAILKWQCEHTKQTDTCIGLFCDACGEKLGDGSGEHDFGEWTEKTPATAIAAKVEICSCSKCPATEERTVGNPLGWTVPVDGVYNVENEDQLIWFVHNVNNGTISTNVSVALKADITLTNGLDSISKTFSGKFDGEDHTLSGINNTLFARTASGFEFKNITLNGAIDYSEHSVADTRRMAASVALYAEGGYVLENVVSNINITTVATNLNAGGLLGFANQGEITNCTYAGTYTVTWTSGNGGAIGGLVGWLNDNGNNSYITGSAFTGSFTVTNSEANDNDMFVGGLVGRSRNSGSEIVTGCVNNGTLTVTATGSKIYVGGLFGRFDGQKANDVTGCVNNGTVTVTAGTYGSLIGSCGGAVPVTDCIALNDADTVPYCGSGTPTFTNCYNATTAEKIGNAFVMGGETYQKYNFGYLNDTTSALVSTGMTAENAIDAYISLREQGDKHDVRFVLLADMEALKDVSAANVEIVFTLNGEEVRKEIGKFGGADGTFTAYEAVLAAGEPHFAKDGYAFFGLVMIDIPDGAWDNVTLTVTNADTAETIVSGEKAYTELLG